jgi:NADPH:quinone reductase-like Zn-dependent oxidoreductase
MRINDGKGGSTLIEANVRQPQAREGELLIRVRAAGVTPTELLWYPSTHTKDGRARTGAVPGHEFSGVVEALGKGTSDFHAGDEIYGMNDWFADGATAEYCVTEPRNIALKPKTLSHEQAATVPIGALTAWQGLIDRAKIQPGRRILIHGGAGAVGLFAVQLAHLRNAHVIATAAARNTEFLRRLGADEVIDYQTSRFEDRVDPVDVVFDAAGGETLDRSWAVLKPNGRLVTIAADSEGTGTAEQRVKDAFFIVEPNQKQLVEVGRLVDAGTLRVFVGAVVPLEQASAAYAVTVRGERRPGKTVIAVRYSPTNVV